MEPLTAVPATRLSATPVDFRTLEPLLMRVDKPARYIGGEFNTTPKLAAETELRVALAFPDVYDIGMSYHGFKIFYERVNRLAGIACERVFAPWTDFEAQLRENDLPLYMLESRLPLNQADIVGFTLQHEMNYTNLLNMLDLGRIPVASADRGETDPIIIAGGHGAFNPEILADYIDAFVVGDGEWALIQIIETVRLAAKLRRAEVTQNAAGDQAWTYRGDGTRAKRRAVPTFGLADMAAPGPWLNFSENAAPTRDELLFRLAQIPGVYVPRFYTPIYNADKTLETIAVNRPGVPETVGKSNFDVRDDYGCTSPVVPLMRVVHDRFAIEIKRGCMVGCRFCQAGMITRPLRERDPRQIVEIAREGIRNTGYDEISLLSLSSADYSGILELTRALRSELADENVSISLPSLRINAFDVDLADEIGSVRKSGFTFAPEAGSARLREVINKAVDEQRFHETIETVLRKGWRTLKFYFMCGLPTETDEDLQGIVDLTNKAIELGKKYHGGNFQLNISLSPFIPKPQTPFQWHAQPTIEEFEQKYQYIQQRINRRFVSLKKHSVRESGIEGVLSRGDRRVGKAIWHAWQLGCKFDNWHEHMRFDLWQQAFERAGIEPSFFANRVRGKDETFAWDHIEASLGRKFLWKEKIKSELVQTTKDCSTAHCATCQVCDFKEVKNVLSQKEDGEYYAPPLHANEPRPNEPLQKIRLTFSKQKQLRFISHLDLVKCIQLIFRRINLAISHSQGFNPSPRMVFTPPLPMGFGSDGDMLEVSLTKRHDLAEVLERLQGIHLEGLTWTGIEEVPLRSSAMMSQLESASYRLTIEAASSDEVRGWTQILTTFKAASQYMATFEGKNKSTARDLKISIPHVDWEGAGSCLVVDLTVSLTENEYVNPMTALEKLLCRSLRDTTSAVRTRFTFKPTTELAVAL